MYKDEYHPQVRKDLKKLDHALREAVKEHYIQEIISNHEKGELLIGDLSGIRSYHFIFNKQQYRIAYMVDEQIKTIFILMIAKRGEFYTILKRRVAKLTSYH